MAQTRKKRRSKHRGTAAGTIEARGRTGRKPTSGESGKRMSREEARAARLARPPSWNQAFLRAGFAAVMLFVLLQVGLGPRDVSIASQILLCLFAMLIYVPLGYWTDRWIYNRRMRRQQQQ
jgi:hypothetical protein